MKRRWLTLLISAVVVVQLANFSAAAVKKEDEDKEAEALQEIVEDSYVLLTDEAEAAEKRRDAQREGANVL